LSAASSPRVRAQALLAQASAAQNRSLAGFARRLTGIASTDELAQVLCGEIGQRLAGNTVLLMPDAAGLAVRAPRRRGQAGDAR
jgi:two-component system sensor histidine kinase KdpD